MEQPKISVIIPVYNVEEYVEECLKSVINQTLKEIEIICIDDCSTDNSLNILEKYTQIDDRIIVLRHEVNHGKGTTRNTGLKNATGMYIAFLDSDDYLAKDIYEKVFEIAENTKSHIVFFNAIKFDHETRKEQDLMVKNLITDKKYIEVNAKDLEGFLWQRVFLSSKLKSSKVLFPENRIEFEDYAFDRLLQQTNEFKNCKITYINEIGIYYRQWPGSFVHDTNIDHTKELLIASKWLIDEAKKRNLLDDHLKNIIISATADFVINKKYHRHIREFKQLCTEIDVNIKNIKKITTNKNAKKLLKANILIIRLKGNIKKLENKIRNLFNKTKFKKIKTGKIYDCFTFFNELDLLEIRVNVLNDTVDYFVISEANKTHSGNEKEFIFDKNKERFSKFKNKIIYIKVDDMPEFTGKNAWELEIFQRNALIRGLEYAEKNDVIIVSDVDEIPNPRQIMKYKNTDKIKGFHQNMYYCFLNYLNITSPIWTAGSKMATLDTVFNPVDILPPSIYWDYKAVGSICYFMACKHVPVKNGGWHFSYLGGIDSIIKKIESFAHQEVNTSEIKNHKNIKEHLKNGTDIFGRDFKYKQVKIDKSFPKYIRENRKKYQHLILNCYKNNVKNSERKLNEK